MCTKGHCSVRRNGTLYSMILQLYTLLTLINVEVCDGSNKTVNPFTQSAVLTGKRCCYPMHTPSVDPGVTSSRRTSRSPDRKSSVSVYNIMQMLICWQYWNITHFYMQTCNSGWEFKIQVHTQLQFCQNWNKICKVRNQTKTDRSANNPKIDRLSKGLMDYSL